MAFHLASNEQLVIPINLALTRNLITRLDKEQNRSVMNIMADNYFRNLSHIVSVLFNYCQDQKLIHKKHLFQYIFRFITSGGSKLISELLDQELQRTTRNSPHQPIFFMDEI